MRRATKPSCKETQQVSTKDEGSWGLLWLCRQRGVMPRKHLGPEAGAPGAGEGSPSCRLARGKLQGVKVNENFNFISSPGPHLANQSQTVGISLSKDSQSDALPLPLFCSAYLLFSPVQVYH